jgi:hypothetical protein
MSGSKTRRCTRCSKNRALRFFTPRGKLCADCRKKGRSKASHEFRVQDTYGLEAGEYDRLFEAQGGKCAICGGTRRQRLSVDHDHKTGIVRGLLCRMCNGRLLTAARDKPEVLLKAAEYLVSPPAVQFLGIRIHRDNRKETD